LQRFERVKLPKYGSSLPKYPKIFGHVLQRAAFAAPRRQRRLLQGERSRRLSHDKLRISGSRLFRDNRLGDFCLLEAVDVKPRAIVIKGMASRAKRQISTELMYGFEAKYGGLKPSGLTKEAKDERRGDRYWLSQHSWIRQNNKELPRHAVAEMHRELNRQEVDYDLTVRPIDEAADAAFDRRYIVRWRRCSLRRQPQLRASER
jgi:hypothetical protein